jgi:hypothetical protein
MHNNRKYNYKVIKFIRVGVAIECDARMRPRVTCSQNLIFYVRPVKIDDLYGRFKSTN